MSRILPILFNTDMVWAILDGRKTATRRIIKLPSHVNLEEDGTYTLYADGTAYESQCMEQIIDYISSPYSVGDILYVREAVWQKASGTLGMDGETETALWNEFKYVATDEKPQTGWNYSWIKRPSIHMTKETSRIWLKVTDVRVERLQDITEEQARAEGCIDFHDKIGNGKFDDVLEFDLTARDAFVELWNSTLKKDSSDTWAHNPWVWVYEFGEVREARLIEDIVYFDGKLT